jgi:hypothetical protein
MNDEDLRDLFAGLAMQSIIHEVYADNLADHGCESIARKAYYMADKMLDAKYADDEPEPVPEPEMGITAIKPKRKAK